MSTTYRRIQGLYDTNKSRFSNIRSSESGSPRSDSWTEQCKTPNIEILQHTRSSAESGSHSPNSLSSMSLTAALRSIPPVKPGKAYAGLARPGLSDIEIRRDNQESWPESSSNVVPWISDPFDSSPGFPMPKSNLCVEHEISEAEEGLGTPSKTNDKSEVGNGQDRATAAFAMSSNIAK